MISRLSILPAMMLAATGLLADEVFAPVYQVGFEVIEGDPTCTGPHERLIRTTLEARSSFREATREKICTIEVHKGGAVEEKVIPCVQADTSNSGTGTTPKPDDEITLTGTFEICQGIWENTYSFSNGLLGGSVDGVALEPAPLGNSTIWSRQYVGAVDIGTVQLNVGCDASLWSPGSPIFDAQFLFQLTDTGGAECSSAECVTTSEVLSLPVHRDWAQTGIFAICVPKVGETAP